ncbi:hypothetical protein [Aquisphaera insulae]|uniref:hypothetical protein n=1 Tax=Aquisphaera insulae TaxID=2712864 RepID=UPI0013E9ACE1|nr:hypothetical protein [Aquisphaera insulae]
MMPHDRAPGDASADLQFDRAEFADPPGDMPPAGDVPAVATDVEASRCLACRGPIEDVYYEVHGQVVCPTCRGRIGAARDMGSPAGRLLKALLFGLGAAIIGSILYYAFIAFTGWNFGLVAVVLGVLVGGAVRAGSGGRGGPVFQALAVVLAYLAIAAMAIPDNYSALIQAIEDRGAEAAQPQAPAQPAAVPPPPARPRADARAVLAKMIAEHPSILLVLGFSILISPVELAMLAPISGLIYAFALWEAWKINRRAVVTFNGPYRLAAATCPPAAEKPPEAADEP